MGLTRMVGITSGFTSNRVVGVNVCSRCLNNAQFRNRLATDTLSSLYLHCLYMVSTVMNYCPNGPLTVPM
jgi:hypothetical protein